MVKHVALIIGCVILSFSADLIVPTSCSPIGENEQQETNLVATRSKRSQTSVNAGSSSSASSMAQTASESQLLSILPLLAKLQAPPAFSYGRDSYDSGLAGLLKSLPPQLLKTVSPLFTTLGGGVANVGDTLDNTLSKIGGGLGFLGVPVTGLSSTLDGILGSIGKTSYAKPSFKTLPTLVPFSPYSILEALTKSTAVSSASSTSTSSSSSEAKSLG